jgi:hypothetical protein
MVAASSQAEIDALLREWSERRGPNSISRKRLKLRIG